MIELRFFPDPKAGAQSRSVRIHAAIVAGWTGRDADALRKHIAELEELGVKPPASTPIFYRVAAARITTAMAIEASGTASSGEVEFVMLRADRKLWIGVGSDHTDREVETYSVTVSKQMCDKPIAPEFWLYDDLASHWDRLILRSYIPGDGGRVLYQEGAVAGMLAPEELLARRGEPLDDGVVMFGGTHPARGGIRPAPRFDFEIEDPVLGRTIRHGYDVASLPVLG